MSFFITSVPPGTGNLGGIAGADAICQNLAAAAGAGNKTWHALSQEARPNARHVNARGRIGPRALVQCQGTVDRQQRCGPCTVTISATAST